MRKRVDKRRERRRSFHTLGHPQPKSKPRLPRRAIKLPEKLNLGLRRLQAMGQAVVMSLILTAAAPPLITPNLMKKRKRSKQTRKEPARWPNQQRRGRGTSSKSKMLSGK